MTAELRVGQGIDLHRLVKGRRLMLGGVEIPSELGLDGHSDADVLLHAVTDALLGAAGLPDIGTRFPPSEARWKDADSMVLLSDVWREINGAGWCCVNLDCTLVAETPKVAPHAEAMRRKIAGALGITPDRVGIKATTPERMGALGNREGIAASCVVLLSKSGS